MIQNCQNKSNQDIKDLADFLHVISEENRLRIICFLQKNNEQCVCEIWEFLKLPQNLVSHHLRVLKDFGLLKSRKEGQRVCYCVASKELDKYKEMLTQVLNEGDK